MTRYKLMVGATVAAFAISVFPASAQRPGGGGQGGGGGERASGGGPGSGGGGGNSGGGGSSTSSGGGSTSSSSGGGGSSADAPSGGSSSERSRPSAAPRNPRAGSEDRRGGDRAVARGSGESRGTARVGSGEAASSSPDRVSTPSDRAVPAYSRPREGRNATGTAVERQSPPVRGGRNDVLYPYYSNYYPRYNWPGYGLGLGYYSYDPFWFDPYYDPYSSGGYYGGGGGYGYQGSQAYRETGSLRLKLKPKDAKVYIDGYFVGVVDSFDGLFQKLGLEAGGHRVEVRAEGYESLQFEVLITPGESVTYKGELKRVP
jgi:hypothetical protein